MGCRETSAFSLCELKFVEQSFTLALRLYHPTTGNLQRCFNVGSMSDELLAPPTGGDSGPQAGISPADVILQAGIGICLAESTQGEGQFGPNPEDAKPMTMQEFERAELIS